MQISLVKALRLIVVFSLMFFSPLTYAWNAIGHMVVANIAYQNLKPTVREKVDTLVGYLHKEYPETGSFLQIAYWMDEIRSQHINTYTHWHYIDVPFSTDNTPLRSTIDTDNAVWAVNHIKEVVRNDRANVYERARFLAFLVHVVGDLHQPLHTVSYISAAHPKGDAGGNLYYIRFNNERINLHKIWDSGVGSFTGSQSVDHINQLTSTLTAMYPASSYGKQVADLDTNSWTKEGTEIAKQSVYNTPENQPAIPGYGEAGQRAAQKQAVLAGYRLAAILNQLLG